ncbi:DNA ligase/mRNA capping enzyme [Mycena amicta]|nr:DNA ligase/mRNA capping enzyme [Mycena amicta]
MADELAEIDGHKPNILLNDGDDREVKSMTSDSTYKVKRTWDHYYCTCPAWRNQAGAPVNARSCKHLQELLGSAYEAARLKLKNPDGPPLKTAGGKKKPASKAKPASRAKAKPASSARSKGKRKAVSDDDSEEEDEKPRKKKPKKKSDDSDEDSENESPRKKKGKGKAKRKYDSEDESSSSEDTRRKKKKAKKYKTDSDSDEASKRVKDEDADDKPAKKPASRRKPASKRAKDEDDDDDDDDDGDNGLGPNGQPAVLLANKWDIEKGPDPTGNYWISEKLDGVRTLYNGKGMVSRLGNPFTPPKWFLDSMSSTLIERPVNRCSELPKDVILDGELFAGRGKFSDTVSIVKTMNSPHWQGITFQIFDIPSNNGVFEDRMKALKKLFGPGGKYECSEVVLVEHEKAKSRQHVLDKLKEIEGLGGEGLMLRRVGSKYEGRRSSTLLKVKTFYDAEAEGQTGALKCKMQSGKTFNVGSGLTDKQRKHPPKIGSIITYRFQELTRDGVPRFPTFAGEAIDKKKAKDACSAGSS